MPWYRICVHPIKPCENELKLVIYIAIHKKKGFHSIRIKNKALKWRSTAPIDTVVSQRCIYSSECRHFSLKIGYFLHLWFMYDSWVSLISRLPQHGCPPPPPPPPPPDGLLIPKNYNTNLQNWEIVVFDTSPKVFILPRVWRLSPERNEYRTIFFS